MVAQTKGIAVVVYCKPLCFHGRLSKKCNGKKLAQLHVFVIQLNEVKFFGVFIMKKFLAMLAMVTLSGAAIAQSATGSEASGGAAGGQGVGAGGASGSAGAGAGASAGAGAAGAGAAAGGLGVAGAVGVAAALGTVIAVSNDDNNTTGTTGTVTP